MSQFATPRAPLTPRRRISTLQAVMNTPASQRRATTRSTLGGENPANQAVVLDDDNGASFLNYIGANTTLPAMNDAFIGSDGPAPRGANGPAADRTPFDQVTAVQAFQQKSEEFVNWVESQDSRINARTEQVQALKGIDGARACHGAPLLPTF